VNEPHRLRELSPGGLERALLDAGMAYGSSEAARAKTLAALGLAGSAVVAAGAVSASTTLFGKLGWTKLLVISGLGAAAVVPAGYYALEARSPVEVPQAVAVAPAPKAAPVTAPQPAAREPEAVSAVELPQLDEPNTPPPRADARAASQSALAAELEALDAARARLNAGDAAGALTRLDDYGKTFPRGRLALEAEVLRMDALAKNGQSGAAAKRAQAFLRRYPNSVLASRVRAYLPED
jgi:hypothetical protein